MTIENRLHDTSLRLSDLPERPPARRVLLCSPEHFEVIDTKNVHMRPELGVDKDLAHRQWESLRGCYEKLKDLGHIDEVAVIQGAPDCEDMVFCANQSLPWPEGDGGKAVFLSTMKHTRRRKEVAHFERFYRERGYRIVRSATNAVFEGMGDAIAHPGRRLLYGGHGFRSEKGAYEEVARALSTPVLPLRLVDERFYHLDTCFLPLDEETALILPEAFDTDSRKLIGFMFENVLHAPPDEAARNFALNAHVLPDQKVALIPAGNPKTTAILRKQDFIVYEIDTSEFLKSGGSVFCMKMMWY